ncbi:IS4 family transposase [Marichromatium bheemlicum]|uniref:IS4 family transposase n=1 Tax=Marichromatium bheemlicum TaxID=365339 RepID=A0ABX1IB09_9GAMM|nr:IS4 family transposase [Marichromatium bheemlicum]
MSPIARPTCWHCWCARELRHRADYLVRASHNRALPEGRKLWSRLEAAEPLGELCFELPAGKGRKARRVRQQLRAERVALDDRCGGTLAVTCLVATEIGAPSGVRPIVWRLLTNREVSDAESVAELIDWYRARWEIELFFRVLKEGCRVEALQLAEVERIEKALVLFLIIAWRITRLMRLGRALAELDAELLFERQKWQAAY